MTPVLPRTVVLPIDEVEHALVGIVSGASVDGERQDRASRRGSSRWYREVSSMRRRAHWNAL